MVAASSAPSFPSLTAAAFEPDAFQLTELVASLTDNLVQQSRDGAAFDPKPFISSFEGAVERLIPLRRDVASKTTELETDVAFAEKQYTAKLRELKDNFEAVSKSFGSLETRISEIGRTAIRVGEQLETIDRVRQRASGAHDIILYYLEFSKGDISRLETLRKEGGRDGRAKVAVLARKLAQVAKEVEDIEGGEATRDTIDKYCERFEKDMLKLFDRYYRKGDPKMMAHCAQVLLDFNGGQSCIQIYVNQHDFFITSNRVQDATAILGTALGDALPDPQQPAPRSEPGLQSLLKDIRDTVNQEAQIVQAVFPNPASVMQVFLQRVFAQVVQAYIEQLVETASSISSLAFLRVLQLSHRNCNELVDDLKNHAFFRTASINTSVLDRALGTALPPSTPSGLAAPSGAAAVAHLLDQMFDELYAPYLEGTRYLERESKSLTELYAAHLLRFVNWHQAQNKTKASTGVFDRMVNQLTNASLAAGSSSGGSGTHHTSPSIGSGSDGVRSLKTLLKLGNSNSARGLDVELDARDGALDLDVAKCMLEWHAEAVGRMVELTAPSDVPKSTFGLLRVLADSFGRAYIETALDTVLTQIAASEGKTEPDLHPLNVIALADMTMHLWQRYVATALVPLASSSVTVRREMSVYHNHVVVRIEGKINEVLQRAVDVIVAWLGVLLAKQKRLDYKPKNDEQALDRNHTEPCASCCDFLHRVREAATSSLNGKNCEAFLSEVGIAFHSQLVEHLKKFPVSVTGSLLLTKDLGAYQDVMGSFGIPVVTERFEMARQLGNLFVISPEIIKTYMSESHLAKIDDRLLRPFLMQRADYNEYSKRFWSDICGDAGAPTPTTAHHVRTGSQAIASDAREWARGAQARLAF